MWRSLTLVGAFLFLYTLLRLVVYPEICPSTLECDETTGVCPQETVIIFNNTSNITNFAYGLTANLAAAVLYGSTFVPVKKTETGDGKQNDSNVLKVLFSQINAKC